MAHQPIQPGELLDWTAQARDMDAHETRETHRRRDDPLPALASSPRPASVRPQSKCPHRLAWLGRASRQDEATGFVLEVAQPIRDTGHKASVAGPNDPS